MFNLNLINNINRKIYNFITNGNKIILIKQEIDYIKNTINNEKLYNLLIQNLLSIKQNKQKQKIIIQNIFPYFLNQQIIQLNNLQNQDNNNIIYNLIKTNINIYILKIKNIQLKIKDNIIKNFQHNYGTFINKKNQLRNNNYKIAKRLISPKYVNKNNNIHHIDGEINIINPENLLLLNKQEHNQYHTLINNFNALLNLIQNEQNINKIINKLNLIINNLIYENKYILDSIQKNLETQNQDIINKIDIILNNLNNKEELNNILNNFLYKELEIIENYIENKNENFVYNEKKDDSFMSNLINNIDTIKENINRALESQHTKNKLARIFKHKLLFFLKYNNKSNNIYNNIQEKPDLDFTPYNSENNSQINFNNIQTQNTNQDFNLNNQRYKRYENRLIEIKTKYQNSIKYLRDKNQSLEDCINELYKETQIEVNKLNIKKQH